MLLAPTTTDLRRLATDVERFTKRLIAAPLASPATPDLIRANDARHDILDLIITLSQAIEAEIVARRSTCCLECHATAEEWGRFEADREDTLSDLDRVLTAERTQLNRGVDPEPWHSWKGPMEEEIHPMGVGAPTEAAIHAAAWDAERKVG